MISQPLLIGWLGKAFSDERKKQVAENLLNDEFTELTNLTVCSNTFVGVLF